MSAPQFAPNNDATFLSILIKYREVNPDNRMYMDALKQLVNRIMAGQNFHSKELIIVVYLHDEGSHHISLHLLENRTLSELWILMSKVPMSSELNVLLYEELKKFARKASPEVVTLPRQVKYLKGDTLQSCNFEDKYMVDYDASHLVWIEHMLRTTGFFSKDKQNAAEFIQRYCKLNIPRYNRLKNKLKQIKPLPVRPEVLSSESDRVLDADMILAMKVLSGEVEEGEIREEAS